ncbi:MAG: pyruvate formate lyase-activating protein [Acholeplasmatales bacterium]|nr:pyruvate formate lyase-activating protein [Acholeplasmatales bacterium]
MEIKAYYSKLESFALVDGPGVRSVLFLSGCPFRCLYCHNPETWTMGSNQITVEEAYNKMIRFLPYWKNNGGVTISGGEPLLQMDFLIELFKKFKEKGVSTCIDTAGGPFSLDKEFLDKFDELLKYTDLFLMDIKAPNELLHKKITGKSILAPQNMFKYLNEKKVPIWIRYVLVPGLTDDIDTLKETKAFIDTLDNVLRIEVLPYHPFAIPKYEELKIDYPLKDTNSPSKENIKIAEEILGAK